MPQGTVLGPLLFKNYENDLHRAIDKDNCQVFQYADDIFLYSSPTNENIARIHLEKNFEELCYYFRSHQLMMNYNKTEYNVFAALKKARTPSYLKINGVNIGKSLSVRYLGTTLDNKINFKEEIKRIISRMAYKIKILKNIRN